MNWYLLAIMAGLFALVWWWRQSGFLDMEQARSLLRQGARVVDVRTPGEFQRGHLPGAINIPLDEISRQISRQIPDPNTVLLLHCQSGVRSGMAQRTLRRLGYPKAFNVGSYGRAELMLRDSSSGSLP